MISSVSSSGTYASTRSSSEKVVLSDELLDYLDNSGAEGKKLSKTIKKLVSDSNGDLKDSANLSDISKYGKSFMKSYNKVIDYCRKNEDDDELKNLSKKLESLTMQNKDKFSNLGITVQAYGKLKITDSILYENSVTSGKFSEFVTNNSGKSIKMFDKMNKIARSLEKDNTAFLDSTTLSKMNNYFWKKDSSVSSTPTVETPVVSEEAGTPAVSSYRMPGSTFSNYA